MVFKLKIRDKVDQLTDRYNALVRDAHLIQSINPKSATEKLRKAAFVQKQIEELKIARNN